MGEVIAFKPKTGHRRPCLTPLSVTDAIIAFDDGERVEPFSFQLRNAHVFAAHCGVKEKMPVPSWKAVRRSFAKSAGYKTPQPPPTRSRLGS